MTRTVLLALALAPIVYFTTTPDAQAARTPYWGKHRLSARQAVVVREIRRTFHSEGRPVVRKALQVAYCESRFDHRAKNQRSTAFGVFQLLYGAGRGVRVQVRNALVMYRSRGWQPWEQCT